MQDFTIITAVYNTALFLDEAIESVIGQTIGIDHIQLILVNDASTDDSLTICRKWEKLYPDHIKVIDQATNQGVSAVRNTGMKAAVGKYVSFMDSDDKLTANVCEEVNRFFKLHASEDCDVVALPIIYFDGEKGAHPLNDKFAKGSRVIDLDKEYYFAQNFISSTFIKAEALEGHQFDQRMPFSEDLKMVQEVMMRTHKLGVIADASYLYRKRSAGQQSAMQTKLSNRIWYVPTLKNGLLSLANQAQTAEGKVPQYLQFLFMYELQWRFKEKHLTCPALDSQEKEEFYHIVRSLLNCVDDDIITMQKYISADTKAYAKLLKRGLPVTLLNFFRATRLLKVMKYLV